MGIHKVARHFGLVSFVVAQPALFWAFSIESPDFRHFLGSPLLFFTTRAPRSTLSLRHRRDPVCSGPYLSYSTIPFLGTFWGPFKIILNYHLASSKDNVDLRNGGGTLVLSGSTTKTESSELCAGPGHAGVLTAESSSSNTGIYFFCHRDKGYFQVEN